MATVLTGSRAEVTLQPGKVSQFRLAYIGGVTAATVVAALGYTPANIENETTVPTGAATLNIIHQLNFFRDARNWTGFDLTGSASSNVAMQNVANFCRDTGERVTFPPALIRLTEQIEFEDRSSIVGPRWPGVYDPAKALWLHFDHIGKGLYFSGVVGSHQMENVGFIRTQPNPGAGWAPTDYDYDIDGLTQDLLLRNVLLRSSTRGIKMTGIGRLSAENVKGQVFKRGVEIESAYDTCRVRDVQFWPIWSTDDNVRNYMLENLTAFYSLRNDNPFFTNIFSIWHNIGFRIGQFAGASGRPAGTTSKAKIIGADLDLGRIGVQADAGANGFSAEFHALSVQGPYDSATRADALVSVLADSGRLLLVQADLREGGGNLIRAQGTGNYIGVTGLNTGVFNATGGGWPAIEPTSGNTIEIEGAVTGSPALTYAATGTILTNNWRAWSPTISFQNGTPAAVVATIGAVTAKFRRIGNTIDFKADIAITITGSAAGDVRFTLPTTPIDGRGYGREINVVGTALAVTCQVSPAVGIITVAHTNAYPGGNGYRLTVQGQYEST